MVTFFINIQYPEFYTKWWSGTIRGMFFSVHDINLCLNENLRFFASNGTMVLALGLIVLSQHGTEGCGSRHKNTPL